MDKSYLWTASRSRLQLMRSCEGKNINWIFIPGGPGLGSESLFPLLNILKLPGNLWRLDLPGDGSNTGEGASISNWAKGLIEAVSAFENVIVVAHSRGGMFVLSLPELEGMLKGLVLLDAAPNMQWQEEFASKINHSPVPEEEAYEKNPSNQTLEGFVVAGARYMFTEEHLEKGRKTLENLPYNHEAIHWTQKHFDPTYSAKWVPQKIPCLILAGREDRATPLKFFLQKPEYDRNNILMREIENAGHFPWIENPEGVIAVFNDYESMLA